MGADVHGWVEILGGPNATKWQKVEKIHDDRNYRLFAALADVRNGYGFAGIPTHKAITPFSEPRGLPKDYEVSKKCGCGEHAVTPAIRESHTEADEYYSEDWWADGPDGHSQTWFTLDELIDWDGWGQELQETGVILREQFLQWDGSCPQHWSGEIWGGGTTVVSEADARLLEAIYDGGSEIPYTHVRVSWSRPLHEACDAWIAWMAFMKAKYRWAHAVRIVIGFDN